MSSSSQGESGDDWNDWEEEENDVAPSTGVLNCDCLFCPEKLISAEAVLQHCKEAHEFDIHEMKRKYFLDQFGCVCLVNYIRLKNPSSTELLSLDHANLPWMQEDFMRPVQKDDQMLTYDYEDDGEATSDNTGVGNARHGASKTNPEDLQAIIREKDICIATLQNQIQQMKETMACLISDQGGSEGHAFKQEDEGYFDSYAHYSIHMEMIQDKVRTGSYRDAILKNASAFKEKVVLDVGCGTGILSLFSTEAGARHVYAVDHSDIFYKAMEIIRENAREKQITCMKDRVEEIHLEEKVDIIVSEWMGYFLLFEGMLESVLIARDKWLQPSGLILPDRCTLYMVAVSDEDRYSKYVESWDNVHGFKMSCLRGEVLKEAAVELVQSDTVVSEPVLLKDFDLNTCKAEDVAFTAHLKFIPKRTCQLTSLAGYFDANFSLDNHVHFSTSPSAEPTHWKQVSFYLPHRVPVNLGEVLEVNVTCSPMPRDRRSYQVRINIHGESHSYILQ